MTYQKSQTKAMPLIPWIGGKRRLAKDILPRFPDHTCYVEPFCGAAALLFLKEPSKSEVINDVHSDLVCLYRVVQHHLDEFMRQFRWALASRQIYTWLKDTHTDTLTDIQRAARFFFLMKMGFGGKVDSQTFGTGTTGKARLNLLRLEEDLSAVHLRLHQVFIEHLDWQQCMARYDRKHTLFYCDPPYFGTEGYGVDFGLSQYALMADGLRSMSGKALVSVNDIPEMRKAFAGLPMVQLKTTYTVGASGVGRSQRSELLIANFPLD